MEPDDIDSRMYWDSYCAIARNIQFDEIMRDQLIRVIGLAGLNKKFFSISVEFGKVNDANLDEDQIGERIMTNTARMKLMDVTEEDAMKVDIMTNPNQVQVAAKATK
ncbi:hypothetical protein IWW35_005910 [Coemansia sp. RSA 1878]|nr:hypothetical protein IWW35_005910 [Coemansia sp. RSA 1878]